MTDPVATIDGGENRTAMPAPAWDYENGKRIAVTATSAQTALDEGLWLFIAETATIYIAIGDDPLANGAAAGSRPLFAQQPWGEAVIGAGQKIAAVTASAAVLWAIPAKTAG